MLIDCHVHMFSEDELREAGEAPAVAMERFGHGLEVHTVEGTIAEMDDGGIDKAVLIPMPTPNLNVLRNNNEVASWVRQHSNRLVGFGSVNVFDNFAAVNEIKRCVEELGLVGFKFHPPAQAFLPNDANVYPIWEACARYKVPVMIHTGTTWWGYSKIKYGRPEYIDDIACDFRELVIIMTHWGQPWWEENIAVAWRHPNVYFDISGYGPRQVPERYLKLANSVLQDKALFGTDYPALGFKKFAQDYEVMAGQLKPEVREKISSGNVRRIIPALG
jgi:predicted TIM-barrel fold metal-dependent hydrolase